ncbi:MAG TPA: NAD(P)/FAD-dependent oxidoreductase [Mycobacterium sp.]|nr:NAD(P)/FAD-dependent oxidoreductase [Mycobacterium sp.]
MQRKSIIDPDPTFDVVVVGARVAGAATAMLLARRGLRVALIDRSRLGVDTLSTHALMRAGVLQLHRWGLLDDVRAAGTPPVHRTTFTYQDDVVPVDIEPSDGVDALYAPRRTVLDPVLVNAAFDAGVDVRFGHSVSGLLRGPRDRPGGVTGTARDGRPFSIRARFVVGADGLRSTIARLVDAPIDYAGQYASAIAYGYWSGTDVEDYEWVFRANAAAGAVPTNGDEVCVFVSTTPARIGRGGTQFIESTLRATAPQLAERLRAGTAPATAATRTFRGYPGFLRRAWGEGWALVGDAGYFKDPLSAHGMTDALRDAELLARALASIHSGADEAEALSMYHSTRNALSVPMLELIDQIASHQWTDTQIKSLLMRLSKVMQQEVALLRELEEPGLYSPSVLKGDRHDPDRPLARDAPRHAA